MAGRRAHHRKAGEPAERFTRWCRRNPVVAGLSMTAALLLILVATISSAAYLRVVRGQKERTLAQVDSGAGRKSTRCPSRRNRSGRSTRRLARG